VEWVSWYDAITYCNKLSIMEGRTPCYTVTGVDFSTITPSQIPIGADAVWDQVTCNFGVNGYRLPTESEWEYAARGGTLTHNYYFSGGGSSTSDEVALDTLAWYLGNNGSNTGNNTIPPYWGTKPVKTKKPNELGLYDMTGNVMEWCWNWSNEAFPQATPADVAGP
jgi:formylglycine-generating enzyme required for sulfatase activity